MMLDQRYELLEPAPLDSQLHHLAGFDRQEAVEVVVSTVLLSGQSPSTRRQLEREAERLPPKFTGDNG